MLLYLCFISLDRKNILCITDGGVGTHPKVSFSMSILRNVLYVMVGTHYARLLLVHTHKIYIYYVYLYII